MADVEEIVQDPLLRVFIQEDPHNQVRWVVRNIWDRGNVLIDWSPPVGGFSDGCT